MLEAAKEAEEITIAKMAVKIIFESLIIRRLNA